MASHPSSQQWLVVVVSKYEVAQLNCSLDDMTRTVDYRSGTGQQAIGDLDHQTGNYARFPHQ